MEKSKGQTIGTTIPAFGPRAVYRRGPDRFLGKNLARSYERVAWSELRAGDVVVLYESNGTPVDNGAEHHLIADSWVDNDLGIHAIRTMDPVIVVHHEIPRAASQTNTKE